MKLIKNENENILSNYLICPLNHSSNLSETVSTAEVEESQPLENLTRELVDSPDLKNSCEAAIASYLIKLEEQKEVDQTLVPLQQQLVTALEQAVRQRGPSIQAIEECYQPCTCCEVIPRYLTQKIHQIDHIKEEVFRAAFPEGEARVSHQKIDKPIAYLAGGHTPLISVYTAKNTEHLPGTFVTSNKKPSSPVDKTAEKVLNGAKDVHAFWLKNFGLQSYDNKGSEIKSTIHYGENYANALWNGKQMVYGDGNHIIGNLTELSIMGHEFGHAITGPKLIYYGESGALNEHLSDVWGSLVLQYKKNQTADQASWLIGEGVIKIGNKNYPLRSLKAPGEAYNTSVLGKDPQADHYSKRYIGQEDGGGVHLNSGIPNKAFYLFAKAQGGYAWQKAGLLWYLTFKTDNLLKSNCTMKEFAYATLSTALHHFPSDYKMHQDLLQAWKAVGLA